MKAHNINVPDKPHYFQRDGNGGFLISKSMLAMVVTLLVLSGYVINSVMAYSTMQNQIEDNTESVRHIDDYINTADIENPKIIKDITASINDNREDISIIKTKIDYISESVTEIKETLRNMK